MSEITISTDTKKEEKPIEQEVKDTLKAADEYAKIKEQNDKLETELLRKEALMIRAQASGRAQAGQVVQEKTEKEKADDEAKVILSMIR